MSYQAFSLSLLPAMHSLLQQNLAMASPSPPSFCALFYYYYYLVRRLFVLCAAPTPARNRCAADAFLSARRDEPNEGIFEVSRTCAAELQEGAEEGKPCADGRSVLQLGTGFRPSEDPCFVLDSGAACHVASDKSLFSSSSFRTVTALGGSAAAYLARDGRRLDVTGVGTISCNKIHLPDVLCVPALSTGVIRVSVQQLAERDYLVMFGGGLCYVRERSSGELVGKGRLHDEDGLYHLESLSIPPDNPDATDTAA